jgi:hypothetical protein
MKLPLSCALFVALTATAVQVTSAVELTAENFDTLTAGKNAFVKYQAPCKCWIHSHLLISFHSVRLRTIPTMCLASRVSLMHSMLNYELYSNVLICLYVLTYLLYY